MEHKKRGRPRLRDDRERPDQGVLPTSFVPAQPPVIAQSAGPLRRSSAGSQRTVTSNASVPHSSPSDQPLGLPAMMQPATRTGSISDIFYPPRQQDLNFGTAQLVAFLNLDLRILKTNELFRSAFAPAGEVRGRLLTDFIDVQHVGALAQLQNNLREERMRREPTFLPGIFPEQQEQRAMEALDEHDADAVTQTFEDRLQRWTFHPAGGPELMLSRVRLAKTSIYFTVLTLRRLAKPPARNAAPLHRPRPLDLSISGRQHPPPQPSPTHMQYFTAGPRSPFLSSGPSSPFSGYPTLGPAMPPIAAPSASYGAANIMRPRSDPAFFSRASAPSMPPFSQMQPPQHPSPHHAATTDVRPSSAREEHRHTSLSGFQLPPIVSSAPATPLTAEFFQSAPAGTYGAGAVTPENRGAERMDGREESARKRRRMDINDLVEN